MNFYFYSKPLIQVYHKILNIMKLTFLLSIFFAWNVSASVFSQVVHFEKKENKLSIKSVLNAIENQTDYTFFYNDAFLDLNRPVQLEQKDMEVGELLNNIFKGTNLTFKEQDNKFIVITPKAIVQGITVTGTVTDNGDPVPGVNVVIKGTTNGVVTDTNGKYTITVPNRDVILQYSFIGYKPQELMVGDQTMVNISLQEDTREIEEVVVVGSGTQKKVNLTGAISSVTSEVLEDRPNYNIAHSIQGVMPNVNVSFPDGKPGRAANINIRGLSVITEDGKFAATSPFVLIDGVPGDLNMVNPNDVESISVLKDAASAAIYGARGAYGVMLVKTKNGKANQKIQVNANANYSLSTPLSSFDMVTDPYTFMRIKNEAWTGYNNTTQYPQYRLDYAKQLETDPSLPRTVVNAAGDYEYYHQNNWFKDIYSNAAPQFQANINLGGGGEKYRYYLSLGYVNQEGAFVTNPDKYDRYKVNAKMTINPNQYIEIYNYTDGTRSTYDYPTWFGNDVNVWRYMQVVPTTTLAPEFNPDGTRPRETFFLGYLKEGGRGLKEETNIRNTLGFNINPKVKGLFFRGDFTYSNTGYDQNDRYKRVRTSMKQGVNDYYLGRNSVKQSRNYENYYVLNLYADYELQVDKHHMKFLAGLNDEYTFTNYWWAQRDNVQGDNYSSLNLATGTMTMDQKKEEFAVQGYFFRINYNYDERYLFEMNGRYDLTSRFPAASRGGFFPSASAAWRVNKEAFMESTSGWLSDLKLRVSYGTLGNQQVPNYSFYEKMTTAQINQIIGTERPLKVNPPNALPSNPTWEKSSTIDGGIDLGFFQQKLVIGFDYYVTDVKDMLTKGKTQPGVFGASEPKENAADLRTRGWDLTLSYNDQFDLAGSPFRYRVAFNMADNYTEVTKFDNPARLLSQFYVGQRLGEMWGLETLGLFQEGDNLNAVDQSRFENPTYTRTYGDLKWKDQDGDDELTRGSSTVDDPGDFIRIGNNLPRYNYGFSLGFNWYGFDVSALLQGVGKRDYYPGGEASYFWSVYNRPANSVASHLVGNYWTPDNPNAYFPRMRGYLAMDEGRAMGTKQTRFMQNASYLRFKNLTVGYTFPAQWTQALYISRLNIYFSVENLATFTKLHKSFDPEGTGKDPDTKDYWGDGLSYPMARTFSFGLNLSF